MRTDIRRARHQQTQLPLASLKKENRKKSPAKSTQSPSFLFHPQKHLRKRVRESAGQPWNFSFTDWLSFTRTKLNCYCPV